MPCELSAVRIQCLGTVSHGCAKWLARAAGREVFKGAEMPYVEGSGLLAVERVLLHGSISR